LNLIWRGPWPKKTRSTSGPSLVDASIAFPLESDEGGVAGVVTLSTAPTPKLVIEKLDKKAEEMCVFGSHVAVHWSDSTWGLSRDGGASFRSIEPPAQQGKVLACSKEGARYGTQRIPWR